MPIPAVLALDGAQRPYQWGSRTAVQNLLGCPVDGAPIAELWFGAHPDDPSPVPALERHLDAVIAEDAAGALGPDVIARFGPRLPFLLKIIAAETALSIQVHPDRMSAVAGYAAEEASGIPRDAPERNYRDRNHKPELLCALTSFEALCGFRPVPETLRLLDALEVAGLGPLRARLSGAGGLRDAVTHLLTTDDPGALVAAVGAAAGRLPTSGPWSGVARAIALAEADFPGDVGVVLAVLLNYVRLEPGEAIYVGAGTVHAYLRGTGVEVMASSDNVLRCGLTRKHIDITELLNVTDFTALPEPRWPMSAQGFLVPTPDFRLIPVHVDEQVALSEAGPRIVLCTAGEITAKDIVLTPGRAAFVSAGQSCPLAGAGRVFVAGVGDGPGPGDDLGPGDVLVANPAG